MAFWKKKPAGEAGEVDFSRLPDRFRDADPQSIRATLNEISDVAKDMTGRMNRVLEQSKAPKTREQER